MLISRRSAVLLAGSSAFVAALMTSPVAAFTITYQVDPSAAAFALTIAQAVSTVQALYNNNVTVNMYFQAGSIGGGAESLTGFYHLPYATYTTQQTTNATNNPLNTTLATVVSNFGFGNNSLPTMSLSSADLRAISPAANAFARPFLNVNGNLYDGVITLDTSLSGTRALNAALHEMDEVLGSGGGGSTLNHQGNSFFFDTYGATDLLRYSAAHTGSWTTDTSRTAYFSIDGGVHNLHFFNQAAAFGSDYGDFTTTPCVIQSWQICSPTDSFVRGSLEDTMLEAIGYDPVAHTDVPLPGTFALFGGGLAAMGFFGWRRKKAIAA